MIGSACLLVIFEEIFNLSSCSTRPGSYARNVITVDSCHETRSPLRNRIRYSPNYRLPVSQTDCSPPTRTLFRALKNSIQTNKHRQQRNMRAKRKQQTTDSLSRDRNSGIGEPPVYENLDRTTTHCLTLATRTVTGVCTISRPSHDGSEDDPSRDPVPCAKSTDRLVRPLLRNDGICVPSGLMLTFTIIPTTHKPPNRPNS